MSEIIVDTELLCDHEECRCQFSLNSSSESTMSETSIDNDHKNEPISAVLNCNIHESRSVWNVSYPYFSISGGKASDKYQDT